MKYLITGGCGFVGSNLAAEVLKRKEKLIIFDNLFRTGSNKNLDWLKNQGEFKYYPYDIRNTNDVEVVIKKEKPDVVFHLAGQVAMTTSLDNPRLDFEVNTIGTLNLLESIRKYSPETSILYSSTNKVYGDFREIEILEEDTRYTCPEFPDGFDESLQLNFQTPYGCSKGAADQYLLDYHRMYGIKTVVFRHSSMYGNHQNASFDQGWIGWFVKKALETKSNEFDKPFTISGNGKQVRDVLHANDVVKLYFEAFNQIDHIAGNAFNIGGGMENSLSLLELFQFLEEKLSIKLNYEITPWRKSDQKIFVANNQKASKLIGWQPNVDKFNGIGHLIKNRQL